MAILITRISISEIPDASVMKMLSTSIFLGIGAMIPMATILMGYAVRQAQDLEKGIPERMRLFGIRNRVTICNRAVSELIYMAAAFGLYFLAGILFMNLEAPVLSGFVLYAVCMLFFSIMCFMLGHAVAALAKRFSLTYCIVMMVYFACMIFGDLLREYARRDAGGRQTAPGHLFQQGFLCDLDRRDLQFCADDTVVPVFRRRHWDIAFCCLTEKMIDIRI
jgi:ABC-2 type transport system permease protein